MEMFITESVKPVSADDIFEKVIADARLAFGNRCSEDELDTLVKSVVQELYGGSVRVSSFVPLLAIRQVRETLDGSTIIAG